jgi:hypothetical protein
MKYAIDPARLPTMNDWDAKDAGIPNKWQLFIDPEDIDIDLIDVADTVGNILDAAIEAAVEDLLFFLPEWAQDLILALLGPVVDAVRAILDIGDDLQEWLSDTLGVSLGLLDFVAQLIADYFAAGKPLVEIEDPFPVLDADGILIPVLMPLEHIGVVVNTDELILTLDIGN